MAKGLFTQGIAVLCRGVPRIPQIASKLAGFQVVGERPASSEWSMGGPALVLEFRPAVNGYIVVDIVNRQWPDDMGNPKKDAMLFASWSMGHFGPYAYPSNLFRAVQQSWSWRGAESAATSHDSFVRIRTTYVLGAEPDAKVLPADYEPSAELLAITRVAQAILQLPNALCYFNPNGETLKRRSEVNELLERHTGTGMLPLELWSNARFFNLGGTPAWHILDTVGMWQLDVADHEACFSDTYDPSEVTAFLRNASNYVFQSKPVIQDGDTMDGPGAVRWRGYRVDKALTDPPREALRWFPDDGGAPPPETLPPSAA